MKYKHYTLLILLGLGLYECGEPHIVSLSDNFNSGWQFYKSTDTAVFPPLSATWETVDLPHTANFEHLTVKDQWQGMCFYRKSLKLNQNYRGKMISLQFDAAMNVAEVWINRNKMAHHLGGYLPFVIDLSEIARFDAFNTVLVRLDNRDNPITGPKPLKILDFNMYGGLYRNVQLIVKERVHLSNPVQANVIAGGGVFFSTTSANRQQASFEIKSHVQNQTNAQANIRVAHELIDKSGRIVATLQSAPILVEGQKTTEVILNGSIAAPQLWSPAIPNLYTLKTKVFADDQLTDSQTDRIGMRSVYITSEGLFLNGERTFLRGVNNDSREVTFKVDGATLIGPAKVNAQAGVAIALIRTGTSSSNVTIVATANGLKTGSTNFKTY
jgi:beta-galactosidase